MDQRGTRKTFSVSHIFYWLPAHNTQVLYNIYKFLYIYKFFNNPQVFTKEEKQKHIFDAWNPHQKLLFYHV